MLVGSPAPPRGRRSPSGRPGGGGDRRDLDIKLETFRDLDRICKPGAVLATTTSSLPVIAMAAVTERPQDVIGMHFFNPAPIMKLVEVVTTVSTAADVTATVLDVTRRSAKHPVLCGDRAGFIVNAALPVPQRRRPHDRAHYATIDDIDTAMTKGCSLPMGPFALLDVVGNDVSLAIQETLYREFREPGYAPAPMLREIVTAGYLGRKTGRGFRSTHADRRRPTPRSATYRRTFDAAAQPSEPTEGYSGRQGTLIRATARSTSARRSGPRRAATVSGSSARCAVVTSRMYAPVATSRSRPEPPISWSGGRTRSWPQRRVGTGTRRAGIALGVRDARQASDPPGVAGSDDAATTFRP